MLLKHGVRSSVEYAKSFDAERARSLSTRLARPGERPKLVQRVLEGDVCLSTSAPRTCNRPPAENPLAVEV